MIKWAVAVVLAAACASRPASPSGGAVTDHTEEKRWKVFAGRELVLEVSDRPGPIVSTAAPPPGLKPVMHPFLSATAYSAVHEDKLRQALDASSTVDDFLTRLRQAGFTIEPIAR